MLIIIIIIIIITFSRHSDDTLGTFSPHLCVVLVFDSVFRSLLPLLRLLRRLRVIHHLSHTTLSHTIFHIHNFVTHHLSHQLCHTPSFTHQLCHTPSFTHHLCHPPSFTHTTLSPTIFHTQLSHTSSFTHNFVTHHLSNTIFVTHVLSHIYLRFTWQAWYLETSCVWRGRRGTWRHLPAFGVACVALVAFGGALGPRWSPLVARGAAPVRVASVALGDIYLRFRWQAWNLETSTCVSCGKRGTWRHLPAFHVAGMAQLQLH